MTTHYTAKAHREQRDAMLSFTLEGETRLLDALREILRRGDQARDAFFGGTLPPQMTDAERLAAAIGQALNGAFERVDRDTVIFDRAASDGVRSLPTLRPMPKPAEVQAAEAKAAEKKLAEDEAANVPKPRCARKPKRQPAPADVETQIESVAAPSNLPRLRGAPRK